MKASTRDRLIQSARVLFWKQGYNATGMAQILKNAGVRSGSLYHFFRTKENLLLAVLQWYRANLDRMVLQPAYKRTRDPIERIFGILDGYRRQLLKTRFEHGCPVGSLALELSSTHPNARKLLAENFNGWKDAIEQCLADAGDLLPSTANKAQLALFVLTTMEGAVMLARTFQSIGPYDTAVAQLRCYFDQLLGRGDRSSSHQAKR